MFEHYKQLTQDDSRYGRIGYAVIAAFMFMPVFIFVFGLYESDSPQMHTIAPPVEAATQTVEELCASLPMPEKLEFTGKSEPKNDYEQHLVIYDFRSTRRPEEIMPVFLFWFNENGWQRVAGTETTFRKDNRSIYLRHESTPSITNYNIYCSEKK